MKILISNLDNRASDDYFLPSFLIPSSFLREKRFHLLLLNYLEIFFFTIGKCFQKNNFFRLDYLTSSKLKENIMKRLLQKLVCGKELSISPLKTKFYSDFLEATLLVWPTSFRSRALETEHMALA